jgi:hypothetical protein
MSALHTTVPQANAKALASQLIALGDELEAKQDPRWFAVARAAALIEGVRLDVVAIEPFNTQTGQVPS